MKKALITGITGQDGSYLAEFLLDKGYSVYGIIRRSSSINTDRIDHIYQDPFVRKRKFFLLYGDLNDASSVNRILRTVRPDEIYNLAAQSHVKVSFEVPEYTAEITGLGTLRILEAVVDSGLKCKFYQASSRERDGRSEEVPQNERTPFRPVSPYGVAKLFAYWTTVNYREGYGIHASNGILFNHETLASFMPLFVRKSGEIEFDIKPISQIVPFDESKREYQAREISEIQVWGKEGWIDVSAASAYPHDTEHENKSPRFINSRSGAYMATSSHVGFMADGMEKQTGDMDVGDRLETIDLPEPVLFNHHVASDEEAELMGMIVGDGSITYAKRGQGVHAKFTNSSAEVRNRFDYLWQNVTGGKTLYYPTRSGFKPENIVGQLSLSGGNDWLRSVDIYNLDRTKRIPKVILNSNKRTMLAFLRGYNATDGLKKNLCTYEFKNFKTNSATLAMGLWYLIDKTTNQDINLTIETKKDGRIFYSLNILSTTDNSLKLVTVGAFDEIATSQRELSRMSGISRTFIRKIQRGGSACLEHHFHKDPHEIKKIIELPEYKGWFYDLETSSAEFHCGIGKIHVHNSPRRGETFVTRKITMAAAQIKKGLQDTLYLGNLDAKRDWGYAKDYVEAMWLMLQKNKAEDYVIATGQTHTVREFLEETFAYLKIPVKKYLKIDSRYFRPLEVNILQGDASKARKKLGWKPKTGFSDLVRMMADADMKMLDDRLAGRKFSYKGF